MHTGSQQDLESIILCSIEVLHVSLLVVIATLTYVVMLSFSYAQKKRALLRQVQLLVRSLHYLDAPILFRGILS